MLHTYIYLSGISILFSLSSCDYFGILFYHFIDFPERNRKICLSCFRSGMISVLYTHTQRKTHKICHNNFSVSSIVLLPLRAFSWCGYAKKKTRKMKSKRIENGSTFHRSYFWSKIIPIRVQFKHYSLESFPDFLKRFKYRMLELLSKNTLAG